MDPQHKSFAPTVYTITQKTAWNRIWINFAGKQSKTKWNAEECDGSVPREGLHEWPTSSEYVQPATAQDEMMKSARPSLTQSMNPKPGPRERANEPHHVKAVAVAVEGAITSTVHSTVLPGAPSGSGRRGGSG
ncbi:hypothetical protein MPTK2_7g11390 [Marchantia polymorpha subsp. ruderalis]